MLNEERKQYQAFAMACMKNKTRVKHGNGTYIVGALIYSLRDKTDEEMFTVLLHDVGKVESSITVGLEVFYNENTRNSEHGADEEAQSREKTHL